MGQYYKIVNLTKKQYLDPFSFDTEAKLMEFACNECGIMTALAVLLVDGNGRGDGDLHAEDDLIGSWAGDKIVVTGDYADKGKFGKRKDLTLYEEAINFYENISNRIFDIIKKDAYVAEKTGKR